MIGKEDVLETLNRQALRIAQSAAAGQDLLVAGDICNTNVDAPGDPSSHKAVAAMFAEQVAWAKAAGFHVRPAAKRTAPLTTPSRRPGDI